MGVGKFRLNRTGVRPPGTAERPPPRCCFGGEEAVRGQKSAKTGTGLRKLPSVRQCCPRLQRRFLPSNILTPPANAPRGRTLRCAWGPIYVSKGGSDLLSGWIHLFFRNLLFLLENRHTLLTFLHYTMSQIVDEPLKTISPLIMKEQPAHTRAVLIFLLFSPPPPTPILFRLRAAHHLSVLFCPYSSRASP